MTDADDASLRPAGTQVWRNTALDGSLIWTFRLMQFPRIINGACLALLGVAVDRSRLPGGLRPMIFAYAVIAVGVAMALCVRRARLLIRPGECAIRHELVVLGLLPIPYPTRRIAKGDVEIDRGWTRLRGAYIRIDLIDQSPSARSSRATVWCFRESGGSWLRLRKNWTNADIQVHRIAVRLRRDIEGLRRQPAGTYSAPSN